MRSSDWRLQTGSRSFQVTPLNDSWGIPYKDESAWGLDPYFFENGTITAGVGNIAGGERQKLAYLIGGHDAGEGANAALDAYLETGNPKYLEIFNVYYGYFLGSQIPGTKNHNPSSRPTRRWRRTSQWIILDSGLNRRASPQGLMVITEVKR